MWGMLVGRLPNRVITWNVTTGFVARAGVAVVVVVVVVVFYLRHETGVQDPACLLWDGSWRCRVGVGVNGWGSVFGDFWNFFGEDG